MTQRRKRQKPNGGKSPTFDEASDHIAKGTEDDGSTEAETAKDPGLEGGADAGSDEEDGDECLRLDIRVDIVVVIGTFIFCIGTTLFRVVSARSKRGNGGDAQSGPVGEEI